MASDIDPGASTGNLDVGLYDAGWSYPTVGTNTSTSTSATGLSTFGAFQLGELGALPVKFVSTKASRRNNNIQLVWQVAEESNIQKYVIERSGDGLNYSKVGEITSTGNSRIKTYHWLDENPLEGNNFYYVRAIQADGKSFVSKVVAVNVHAVTAGINIFPNPVTDNKINIQGGELQKGKYSLRLTNSQGQQIFYHVLAHPGGLFTQVIPTGKIPTGMYHLQIMNEKSLYTKSILIK